MPLNNVCSEWGDLKDFVLDVTLGMKPVNVEDTVRKLVFVGKLFLWLNHQRGSCVGVFGNSQEEYWRIIQRAVFTKLPSAVVRVAGKPQRCSDSFGQTGVWKALRNMSDAACTEPSEKWFPGSSSRCLYCECLLVFVMRDAISNFLAGRFILSEFLTLKTLLWQGALEQ